MPKPRRTRQLTFSLLRPLGALCVVGALSACSDPVTVALGGASVVSMVQTGKTISDHAMSAATGMDCSIRHTLTGESWCQPDPGDAPDPADELACYRSIAEVTCYRQDNPHETDSRRIQ